MNTRRITKVIISTIVIGTAVGYLLVEVIESSWAYYYSVDEFVESRFVRTSEQTAAEAGKIDDSRIIRLAGRVKKGSVVRDPEKMQLDFELAGQENSIAARYYGPVPQNFTDDKEVLVEGSVGAEGLFRASQILTRCESKYKARLKTVEKPDKK